MSEQPEHPGGVQAPTVKQNPEFEILYWIGCAGSYDRRAQRVARAVVKLLNAAGVNFAILGNEEKCTGDSARRLGDEFLFQELAETNIATLAKYSVRRIVAHCPHCVNALLRDYRQFGGEYEVVHHTQYLAQLLGEGRLRIPGEFPDLGGRGSGRAEQQLTSSPEGGSAGASPSPDAGSVSPQKPTQLFEGGLTYHDPCYLARVNGIHEAPREVLRQAIDRSGGELREMARNREQTSCCGAGGGRMWFEEAPEQRVSTQRAGEALATGAETVAVGCPFCLTMMTDGVAANESEARVLDVAEILAQRLGL